MPVGRADSGGQQGFETGVDLAGLMAVLSEHLYSTSDVAVRELVQNAHDSISRRQILMEQGVARGPVGESYRISVRTDPQDRVVEITDNGSGLTYDEIHRTLATVGAGVTGDLRASTGSDDLIGMFGLGFLSAFVVADEVVVTTTSSLAPRETWRYRSADGFGYQVDPAPSAPIGTTVRVRLSSGFADLAEPEMVDSILRRYCRLLTHPISLNDAPPINLDPPWRSEIRTRAEQLAFAVEFDPRFEPLAVVPLGGGASQLQGQMWIHGGTTYGNADNRQVSVYVRGMLLAENDSDLLPRWAGFVSGVIESPSLAPTASRETLQRNAAYTEAQMEIAEALVVGLSDLALADPPTWRRILDRHSQALLGAAIADDRLFDLVADQVVIPSSQGDRTVAALRHGRRLYVSLGADRGFEELLFLAQGLPVIRGDLYGVISFLTRYCHRYGLELITIGTDSGSAALFDEADISADDLAWLNSELAGPDEAIHPARFDPDVVPLVVVPDREAELKRRIESDELNAAAGDGAAALARSFTAGFDDRPEVRVYVNLACPTIERLLHLRSVNPSGATRAVTLLNTIKALMVASDRGSGGAANLTEAFGNALTVMDGLLIDANPRSSDG